jgi:hypothetical protein
MHPEEGCRRRCEDVSRAAGGRSRCGRARVIGLSSPAAAARRPRVAVPEEPSSGDADTVVRRNNYRGLWSAQETLLRLGVLKIAFDVNKHIEPKHISNVMKKIPELPDDLPKIPDARMIGPGFVVSPEGTSRFNSSQSRQCGKLGRRLSPAR